MTAHDSTGPKMRTITLTGRPPVRVDEAMWPVVARAAGDSGDARDHGRYTQALAQGELDTYVIRVRQHADGRAVVYAVLDASTAWTGTENCRGGEVLAAGGDVAAAILRVARDVGIPEHVARQCVADLPAVELV